MLSVAASAGGTPYILKKKKISDGIQKWKGRKRKGMRVSYRCRKTVNTATSHMAYMVFIQCE